MMREVRGIMSQKQSNVIMHDFSNHSSTKKEEPLILPLTIQQVAQFMDESKYILQNWIRDLREYVPIEKNQSGYNVFYEDGIKTLLLIQTLHRKKGYSIKQIDKYFQTNGEWFEFAPEIPNLVLRTDSKTQPKDKNTKEPQSGLIVPLFDENSITIEKEIEIENYEEDSDKYIGIDNDENEIETVIEEVPDPPIETENDPIEVKPENVAYKTTERTGDSIDSSSLVNSINHLQKSIEELNQIMSIYIEKSISVEIVKEPEQKMKEEQVITEPVIKPETEVPDERYVFAPRGSSRKKKHKQDWKQILLNYIFFWFRWLP